MAFFSKLIIIFTLLLSLSSVFEAHQLGSSSTLLARLKLDEAGTQSNCWGSLLELQSCSGEIVLFFLNGETFLGPDCCRAIRTIGRDRWPTMMGSLGYTSQEGDVLQDYCGAADKTAQRAVSAAGSHVVLP